VLKWVGLALTSIVVAAWVVSTRMVVEYVSDEWKIGFGQAVLYIDPVAYGSRGWWTWPNVEASVWPTSRPSFGRWIVLPLWLPLLLLAPVTAFLWYSDRCFPPGHCQNCGYDLTGNVSGRCPECGCAWKLHDSQSPGGQGND
jgi:hypothetical protein